MTEDFKNKYPADFDLYLRQGDGDKAQKAANWQTAIGLQAVDGLKTSDYLHQTALRHIEGEIDIDQAGELLRTYYQSKTERTADEENMREADLVSRNIAKILSTHTLDFSTEGYMAVHRKVFDGVYKFAGKLRDYDITKREWILDGDSVSYLDHEDLRRAISHDIQQEKEFSYNGLSLDQAVEHIARFVSGLWQIHPFGEGNTRTTAVFCIQYLRSIGFSVDHSLFADNSWYFRNALVCANYKNAKLGIDYDYSFLIRFFRNLLLGEQNELKNRFLHLKYVQDSEVQSANNAAKNNPKCKNCTLDCTLQELALLKIIEKNPRATQKEIATAICKSERTVKTMTINLSQRGILKRKNGKRNGYWEICDKPDVETQKD